MSLLQQLWKMGLHKYLLSGQTMMMVISWLILLKEELNTKMFFVRLKSPRLCGCYAPVWTLNTTPLTSPKADDPCPVFSCIYQPSMILLCSHLWKVSIECLFVASLSYIYVYIYAGTSAAMGGDPPWSSSYCPCVADDRSSASFPFARHLFHLHSLNISPSSRFPAFSLVRLPVRR